MTSAAVKKVDGIYTRMLQKVKNASWKDRLSNAQLYGQIPKLSIIMRIRWLALAKHVARHNEPENILLFWAPDEARRRRHPNITYFKNTTNYVLPCQAKQERH